MYVINSFQIPLALECKVKLPKGKILSFNKYVPTSKGPGIIDEYLFVSIWHHKDAPDVDYEFYIILESTEMKITGDVGKFWGSFDINNDTYHVFNKI